VPPHSGVLSAVGLLLATPRADSARTVMLSRDVERLRTSIGSVADSARQRFEAMFGHAAETTTVTADMRYVGQSHELEVSATADWEQLTVRFHTAHRERFGFDRPGENVEVVNVRAVAIGRPPITWADLPTVSEDAVPVGGDGVWQRSSLPAGFETPGPAVIIEDNSASLLESEDRMTVLEDGSLEITSG
jgi:N-methylhydantoinase A